MKNIDLKIGIKQELEQRLFFTNLLFVYHKADVTLYAQVFKAFSAGLKRCTLVHQRMRHHKHKKEAELFRARCNATLSHPGDGAIDCIFFLLLWWWWSFSTARNKAGMQNQYFTSRCLYKRCKHGPRGHCCSALKRPEKNQ